MVTGGWRWWGAVFVLAVVMFLGGWLSGLFTEWSTGPDARRGVLRTPAPALGPGEQSTGGRP